MFSSPRRTAPTGLRPAIDGTPGDFLPFAEGHRREQRVTRAVFATALLLYVLAWRSGAPSAALRLVSVVLLALAAALVYRLARLLGGTAFGSVCAALIAAVSTMLWPAAAWATPSAPSLVLLLLLIATLASLSYRQFPRGQSLVLSAVALAGAVLVRPANAFVAPVFLVYLFVDPPARIQPQIGRMAVFLIPVAAAAVCAMWRGDVGFAPPAPGAGSVGRRALFLLWGQDGLFWLNPPLALAVGVLVGLVQYRPRQGSFLLVTAAALFVIAVVQEANLPSSGGAGWGPPSLLEVVPLIAAPLGLVLGRAPSVPRTRRWLVWAVTGLLAAGGAAQQVSAILSRDAAGRLGVWWVPWPWAAAIVLVLAVVAGVRAVRLTYSRSVAQ